MQQIVDDIRTRMRKSIETFKQDIAKLRTGRAQPSVLDVVKVEYYGTAMSINQLAHITTSDARTLVVTPWDKKAVSVIEKAIRQADLGLNPATTGEVIRVPMPPLTEERRKALIKVVREEAEQAKVSIRNIRRDGNDVLSNQQKSKTITQDEEHHFMEVIQKVTDDAIAEVNQLLLSKEKDLMEI